MATLKEYFDKDFPHVISIGKPLKLESESSEIEILARVHYDFDSNAKFTSYYVPSHPDTFKWCWGIFENRNIITNEAQTNVLISTKLPGESLKECANLKCCGRVFIYHEKDLLEQEVNSLSRYAESVGIFPQFRNSQYARERNAMEKPLAFISHDSRNKEQVARPLALKLIKMMCPVWYDEFSLKVGDSLRQSIETGLRECKKCILILSPDFFSNDGWTKIEFDSVFTRQVIERKNVVLPVWYKVSAHDVYQYSPSLADRFGVKWNLGIEEVSRQLYRAILE